MSEDHDAVINLVGAVDRLTTDVSGMRTELRDNTASLGEVKLTLARNGINGVGKKDGRTVGIAVLKWVAVTLGAVAVLALVGALTLDLGKAGEVITLAKQLKPG